MVNIILQSSRQNPVSLMEKAFCRAVKQIWTCLYPNPYSKVFESKIPPYYSDMDNFHLPGHTKLHMGVILLGKLLLECLNKFTRACNTRQKYGGFWLFKSTCYPVDMTASTKACFSDFCLSCQVVNIHFLPMFNGEYSKPPSTFLGWIKSRRADIWISS